MRVSVFSTKRYDRVHLEAANAAARAGHELVFLEPHLGPDTVSLAAGSDAVCAFVNDVVDRQVLAALHALRVRGIVVFPDTVHFKDEPPKGAVRASDFRAWVDEVMKMDGTISSATEQSWPAITAMVASAHARIEQARAKGLIGDTNQKPNRKRRARTPAPIAARAR
jgi:hypothetical protein